MGRVIDALIAYRLLKLLVTPFKKTKAYQMGIIDDKGKVLNQSKTISKIKYLQTNRARSKRSHILCLFVLYLISKEYYLK